MTKKQLPQPPIATPEGLRDYADAHVEYEITMLHWAAFFPPLKGTPNFERLMKNVRTEVFGLHLRNLVVFLYPESSRCKPNDVCAHHYFAGATPLDSWQKVRPPMPEALKHAKLRADRELAHLTVHRMAGTPPEKSWDVAGILKAIMPCLERFAKSADASRLGTGVQSAVAQLVLSMRRFS